MAISTINVLNGHLQMSALMIIGIDLKELLSDGLAPEIENRH
jgi:hypothetical protein